MSVSSPVPVRNGGNDPNEDPPQRHCQVSEHSSNDIARYTSGNTRPKTLPGTVNPHPVSEFSCKDIEGTTKLSSKDISKYSEHSSKDIASARSVKSHPKTLPGQ